MRSFVGKNLLLLLLFPFLLAACAPPAALPTLALSAVEGPTAQPNPNTGWYSIYFSQPDSPTAETIRGGPDSHLAAAIDAARASIEVAIHELDLWSLRDALIAAHRRGVLVRMVVESDYLQQPEMQALRDAGIPIIEDRGEGLMHNKFVVIDRFEVWTGSMNFTTNGAYRNDNNLMRVRSSRLAELYIGEFEEMFADNFFGGRSPLSREDPFLTIEGTQLEVYFTPEDDFEARLIQLVGEAQSSIYFLAFSFTSDPIAGALIDAAARGVDVIGVFETKQASGTGGEFFRLADFGLGVELDGNPRNMHHKVFIIDGGIVVTGSYNFTASAAERNDENVLVFHNPEIALLFFNEFIRIFEKRQ
jgi:phosphatidylserine/phosphatidylglycerophosphate/cardiolipin synthase-like enzyme